jgi:phosphate transport system substrate-binding protein
MRLRSSLCAALGLAWLAACLPSPSTEAPAAKAVLTYDGATSISNRLWPLALPVFEQRFGVKVRVGRGGSGKGLKAVLAGEIDLAGLSRPLTPEERALRPSVVIVGYDALGVFVNARSPVHALSREQLKAIFTGAVTSWKAVGGPDRPVVPCTERLDSGRGTLESFRQLVLDGQAFGPVRQLEDPADCLALVATNPDAIAPATTAFALPGVRAVAIDGLEPVPLHVRNGAYLLTRPLLLVTREPASGRVKDLLDLLVSPEGQALVVQAGFMAAR